MYALLQFKIQENTFPLQTTHAEKNADQMPKRLQIFITDWEFGGAGVCDWKRSNVNFYKRNYAANRYNMYKYIHSISLRGLALDRYASYFHQLASYQ